MSLKSRERNIAIDYLKGILIFLVVFGHCLEMKAIPGNFESVIYQAIYSFHMPLFLFISGYLTHSFEIKKSTKQLLVPFTLLQIPYYLMTYILNGDLSHQLLYPKGALWFLVFLFGYRMIEEVISSGKKMLIISVVASIIAFILPESVVGPMTLKFISMMPYFALGISLQKVKRIKFPDPIPLALAIITLCLVIGNSVLGIIPIDYLYRNGIVYDSFLLSSLGFCLRYLFATVFIIFAKNVIDTFSSKQALSIKMGVGTLTRFGRQSIVILALQTSVIAVYFGSGLIIQNTMINFIAAVLISFATCMVGSMKIANQFYQFAISSLWKAI